EAARKTPTAIDANANLRVQDRAARRHPNRKGCQQNERRKQNEGYDGNDDVEDASHDLVTFPRLCGLVAGDGKSNVRELNGRNLERDLVSQRAAVPHFLGARSENRDFTTELELRCLHTGGISKRESVRGVRNRVSLSERGSPMQPACSGSHFAK